MDLLFMVISLQPTIWKTGGKFIVHFFQSISRISDLIESEELHYFLLLKLKEFNYSQTESEQHNMLSVPGSLILMISHPMANSGWVTAQFIHMNLIMSHAILQLQSVSDTIVFLCQEASLVMSHPMINSLWVTMTLHYFLARQSHQSCHIPWPTECEWHCIITLPGSLINHASSNDQQKVSDITLFLCQAVWSIMSHPMTMWQQVSDTA